MSNMELIYARFYANLIVNHLKTIEEVPAHLQAEVLNILTANTTNQGGIA